MSIFTAIKKQHDASGQAINYRNYIRREARIGGTLFGPVASNINREFFCLDEHTWIWHEEWADKKGQRFVKTTRYDVRPDGILKSVNGGDYQKLSIEEAENLLSAIELYNKRVFSEIYSTNSN